MWIFLLNIASTWFMTGLIWFVQVVHYPLHGVVGSAEFPKYQALHMNWTSWVVIPPMLIELLSTVYLIFNPISGVSSNVWWILAVMLMIVWASTGLLQAPTHGLMLQEYSDVLHHRLLHSNWIRTIFWSARGLLLLWILGVVIKEQGNV